ncbi:MAG: ComEC/Rec2 family competence protein, partial [Chloroflexota bacterium]
MRLVWLALGWCAGILLAANAGLHLPLFWLMTAVVALVLAWRVRRIETAAFALLALGGLRMASLPITSGIASFNDLGGMTVTGIVAGEPDRRDDRVQLRLAAETVTRAGSTTPTDGLVLVEAPPLTDARYGDRIAATGLLYTPGESDRFSYADYLARSGVYSLMRESSVAVLQPAITSDPLSSLIDLKARAADAIRQYLPEPQAGLLVGILLGNDRGIAPEVSDAFAATGAAHVIAISGFNMAVLSAVVIGALRRLKLRPAPAALISIAVIGIYTLFVGANPAVVRAALMSGLLVVGTALRRDTYLPASLAFAALLLSALNPLVLWDVSFQLSFFAT